MIKMSVTLPVYNEEPYLRQCLDSICSQTLKEIEIICVDDGSADNSLPILREYETADSRIKVLTQANKYAGTARNYGMREAGGEYYLFLDSDDFFSQDMLEKLYRKAEMNQLDIAICRYDLYDDADGKTRSVRFEERDAYLPADLPVFSGKDLRDAGIFQVSVGWAWDKLFRRTFVEECGYLFPEFRSSEDGFFVYMLMARAERMGIIDDRLVFHRINNRNSLSNTKESDWENGFKMLELTAKELGRQGLYSLYEKSFVGFAVEFQVWYLQSMNEKKAFYNCYQYIRNKMEPEFHFMRFPDGFLCGSSELARYHQVLELEFDELLFAILEEKEDNLQRSMKKGWVFPYSLIPRGCRVVLYGAGIIGQDYREQLLQTEYCREVYLVDGNYGQYQGGDFQVENPELLKEIDFDYVVISIFDREIQRKVRQRLLSAGIRREKIICI